MARIRTIKPEFFTSDDVCALSPLARLLFIGCWCEADREGRLEWRPRTLKRKYLPEDDCDADEICNSLVARGLIVVYGQGLAYVTGFAKHQVINLREAQSKLPEPPAVTCNAHALPAIAPGKGKEGKGREGDSVANATGASAPPVDMTKLAFDAGVRVMTASGMTESNARSLVGKWRKSHGDEAVFKVLGDCQRQSVTDPASWIEAALKASGKPTRKPWEKADTTQVLPPSEPWEQRVRGYKPGGFWKPNDWGPPPESPYTRVPGPILAEWREQTGERRAA